MRTIFSSSALVITAAAALATSPRLVHAQTGPFVGVGAGASRVAEPDGNAARLAPSLNLRAGWTLSRTTSVMLEWSMNGIGSPNADTTGLIDPEINGGAYRNRQLSTGALLASVQLGTPALYVRPGVGLSRHAFTAYDPLPADGYGQRTSHEAGPALGISLGRRVFSAPGFPLNLEGVAIYTRGEDSTSPRWSAGIQVVTVRHF